MLQRTNFRLHKRGNTKNEYEDATASNLMKPLDQDPGRRIAISDGASESTFAAEWAKILTRSYRDQSFTDLKDIQARIGVLRNEN